METGRDRECIFLLSCTSSEAYAGDDLYNGKTYLHWKEDLTNQPGSPSVLTGLTRWSITRLRYTYICYLQAMQ